MGVDQRCEAHWGLQILYDFDPLLSCWCQFFQQVWPIHSRRSKRRPLLRRMPRWMLSGGRFSRFFFRQILHAGAFPWFNPTWLGNLPRCWMVLGQWSQAFPVIPGPEPSTNSGESLGFAFKVSIGRAKGSEILEQVMHGYAMFRHQADTNCSPLCSYEHCISMHCWSISHVQTNQRSFCWR